MDKAAKQLNISIIGGHCEVTPGIDQPIVTGCVIGIAENGKYVSSGGAKIGDKIILTKGTGIEGTAILDAGKEPITVTKGDAIFVKPGDKHSFKNDSTSVFKFICVIPL